MKLVSKDITAEADIPAQFTCDGKDLSPHLAWSEYPSTTQSFVLICHDPDAPSGDWLHWLIINIPKNVNEILSGESAGEELENDFGKKSYGGPCPPSGRHRYFFTVYAIEAEKLAGVDKTNYLEKAEEFAIDKAELMGYYERS